MTDRETILAAADKLEWLDVQSEGMSPTPWKWLGFSIDDSDGVVVGEDFVEDDATLIVALRPVAAPLAAWLRDVAERHVMWHLVGAGLPVCAICRKWPCPDFTSALSVARAVNVAT